MEFAVPRPACMMSDSEVLAALDAVHDEVTRLSAYRLELLARFDDTGHAKTLGAHDTIEFVSSRHRLNPKDVRADLRLAKALPKYEIVTAALPKLYSCADAEVADAEAGHNLHVDQVKAIVNALEMVPPAAMVPIELLSAAENQLVKAARHLNPADLRKLGKQARDILDTDGPEPAEEDAYRREALWHRKADNGVRFGGYLANENAELFQTLIHAGSKPHKTLDGQPDPRGRDKRQADALVNLLNSAATTSTGGTAPHISVTIDYESLKSATKAAFDGTVSATATTAAGTTTSPAGVASTAAMTGTASTSPLGLSSPGLPLGLNSPGLGIGQIVFGDNLSAAAVRRLACDASIIPIVLGSDSQPLDVGMEKRFVTTAIRHALKLRDKGCVICGAPPIQCDAHHLVHWADGGPTALHNLALFCKIHHREVHSGRWTVTIVEGVVHVARPTWADPPTKPRLRLSRLAAGISAEATSPDGWATASSWPPPASARDRTSGSDDPPPTRSWPHTDDIPWITPEESARLNPWAEAPGDDAQPSRQRDDAPDAAAIRLDPWITQEDTHLKPLHDVPKQASCPDPWQDPSDEAVHPDPRQHPSDQAVRPDPWQDPSDEAVRPDPWRDPSDEAVRRDRWQDPPVEAAPIEVWLDASGTSDAGVRPASEVA